MLDSSSTQQKRKKWMNYSAIDCKILMSIPNFSIKARRQSVMKETFITGRTNRVHIHFEIALECLTMSEWFKISQQRAISTLWSGLCIRRRVALLLICSTLGLHFKWSVYTPAFIPISILLPVFLSSRLLITSFITSLLSLLFNPKKRKQVFLFVFIKKHIKIIS